MIARIVTMPLLLLAFASVAAAQPAAAAAEPRLSDAEIEAIRRRLPPRPLLPPPLAELSATPFERSELPGLLLAVASYLGRYLDDEPASIVIDPHFSPRGFPYPPPGPDDPVIIPTAEELAILQTELNAEIRNHDEVVTCAPVPVGCELSADHLFIFGQPVLHVDGTVTMTVYQVSRTEPGYRRATFSSTSQPRLTKTDGAWTVTGSRLLMIE